MEFNSIPKIRLPSRPRSSDVMDPFGLTDLVHQNLKTNIYCLEAVTGDGIEKNVWINDENEANRILKDPGQWKKGPGTYEPFRSIVPLHLISVEGALHVKLRSKAQTALAEAIINKRIPAHATGLKLINAIGKMDKNWMGEPIRLPDGRLVFATSHLDKIFRAATLEVISAALFGESWNSLADYSTTNPRADALSRLMHELHWRVTDFNDRKWRKDRKTPPVGELNDLLDSFILREVSKSKARSTITCMLDSWTRDTELSLEEVQNLCMTFLTMGHENVASALAWTAVLLSNDAVAQDKARSSKEDLVHAFHEAIRLYPSVAVLTRMCEADQVVCGYHIPKHTEVVVNICLINKNERIWGPEARMFSPSRCPVVSVSGSPDVMSFGIGSPFVHW